MIIFKKNGEIFKAELIADLPGSEDIKVYRQGEWLDLCRGPHMPTTKLTGHGSADESRRSLLARRFQPRRSDPDLRYGAWRDEKELQAYLTQLEEAEKRDHRKLGRELGLFHLQDEAQGSVFWHPKGYTMWLALEGYIRRRIANAKVSRSRRCS